MSAADQVPTFYFRAKQIIPTLPHLLVGPDLPPGAADSEAKLEPRTLQGNALIQVRSDYPSSFLTPEQRAIEVENTLNHEAGHPWDTLLTLQGRNHHNLYWAFRKFPDTWDQAKADADRMPQNGWQNQPRESWAECFGAAMSGRWTKNEKTMNWGKTVDAMAARAFFQSLAGVQPHPTPPAPSPQPTSSSGGGRMRVLIHDSHHDPTRRDGWSGAPGEATWVLDLNDRIVDGCRARGIEVARVSGDLKDHPLFHEDWTAFIAPHYEADIHTDPLTGEHIGGSFYGRATNSATHADDERLGVIFWRLFRAIPGAPPDQFGWRGVNVTDYYGFRLTTATTPGILVEHGVGSPTCNNHRALHAPDYQWLRDNIQQIADAWVTALAQFGGIEEDDMFTQADRDKLDRVYALANAEGPRIWTQRLQDWLSKLLHSLPMFAAADYSGPDVTTNKPRT